ENLRKVPVVNPETGKAVLPTRENVESGAYAPYSRPLFVYVNLESMERPEVQLFLHHFLDNASEYAVATGYFPLPPQVLEVAKAHVAEQRPGTTFRLADGTQREGAFIDNFRSENLVNTK